MGSRERGAGAADEWEKQEKRVGESEVKHEVGGRRKKRDMKRVSDEEEEATRRIEWIGEANKEERGKKGQEGK